MFKRLLLALFILALSLYSQTLNYEKLLYEHDLTSETSNEFIEITTQDGEFHARDGWWPSGSDSKMIIKFSDRLPQVGSIEFTTYGFVPTVHIRGEDQVLCMLTSSWENPIALDGDHAWLNIRTGKEYLGADQSLAFELDAAPAGHDTRQQLLTPEDKIWDKGHHYTFRFTFDHEYLTVYIDDEVYAQFNYEKQSHRFKYLLLGGDNLHSGMLGIRYSNFKVYTHEPNGDPYFVDKTFSKNLVETVPTNGGQGVAVADVNGDELEDIYVSHSLPDSCFQNALYVQQADGTFINEAEQRGIAGECGSYGVVFFDADNDGDVDLFTSNDGQANQLYINNGSGYFDSEGLSRGIENIAAETRGAVALDLNGDGWLDIFAANNDQSHEMYINNGNGTFRLENRGAQGVIGNSNTMIHSVTVADIDNDHDPDIFIAKENAANVLYVNNGGVFTEKADERGIASSEPSTGATFADFDNDGDMDLFVSNRQDDETLLLVYENNGLGYFTNHTFDNNFSMDGYTTTLLDIDNDGDLDLYRLNRNKPAQLALNDGLGNFIPTDFNGSDIVGADARACATVDFDQDGDLDMFIVNSEFEPVYLENKNELQTANKYIKIKLHGPQKDVGGVGGKINIYEQGHLGDADYLIGHRQVMTSTAYLSQSGLEQHIGLGQQSACDVLVTFTNGVSVQETHVTANQTIEITAPKIYYILDYISGNNQTGTVNELLAQAFQVRLADQVGTPMANHLVEFVVMQGDGTLGASTVYTNADGLASVTYQLGATTGEHHIEARVPGAQNSPIQFTAIAHAGPAASISKISGDGQLLEPGTAFAQPFSVQVVDAFNNPISGHQVSFTVTSGNGTVNSSSQTFVNTDTQGIASVIWTPDPIYGATNTLSASATYLGMALDGSPVIWNYPGPEISAQLSTITADSLILADGVTAANITVSLKNNSGIGAGAGLTVRLNISGSENNLAWINSVTDQNGQVRATLKSTRAETKTVTATVLGANLTLAQSTQIIFKSLRPDPEVMTLISGNEQNVAANGMTEPFTVQVTNLAGEPVPDHPVQFVPLAGFESIQENILQTIMTDENGLAAASFQVSRQAGVTHIMQAQSQGLANSPMTFSAQSIAAEERIITVISGDQQTGYPEETLPLPVTVLITDLYNNPTANRQVKFTVKSGDCLVNGQNESIMRTTLSGSASAMLTLGTRITESLIEIATAFTSTTIRVKTIAKPAVPDLNFSTISATSPVFPDGTTQSQISVSIVDEFNRPLEDIKVDLMVIGQNCQLTFTDSITNANGQVFAQLSSTTAGEKLVMAMVDNSQMLKNHAVVNFTFGEIQFAAITGDMQTLEVGQTAALPLTVQLSSDGHSLQDEDIEFTILEGKGLVNNADSAIVQTNELGQAQVIFTATDSVGICRIQAKSNLTATRAIFNLTITPGQATVLIKLDGDAQTGDIGTALPEPLRVKTIDSAGNPVSGAEVTFTALVGGSIITPQPVKSNAEGIVEAIVQLDTRIGDYYFQALMQNGANVLFTATAKNQNTAPVISSFEPAQTTLTFNFGQFQIFKILKITDPDQDTFTYEWRLNDELVSQQSMFTLLFLSNLPAHNTLICTVSDGKAQAIVQWTINLFPTAVELSSFQAEYRESNGITISWQTRSQKHNAGFDVQRSLQQNGPWHTINNQRIKSISGDRANYTFTDKENLSPSVYYYRLLDYSQDGQMTEHPAVSVTVAAPVHFALLQNYPNPFNPTTAISFKLPHQADVAIQIYNANGQLVKQLVNSVFQAGQHTVVWNATNDNGTVVPSGLYFYTMQTSMFSQSRKLLLMK